jgi:hypothetical protein
VDVKDKIIRALQQGIAPDFIRLDEDEEDVSGFVVSTRFEGMAALDRQDLIERAIKGASLDPRERRRILMIAGLTPVEYDAVGARIQVYQLKEIPGGVEVHLHGGASDADYVRAVLRRATGVETTEPTRSDGGHRILMQFQAKGTSTATLTKERAKQALESDEYIEMTPGV